MYVCARVSAVFAMIMQCSARAFADLVRRHTGVNGSGLIPKQFVTEFLWEADPKDYSEQRLKVVRSCLACLCGVDSLLFALQLQSGGQGVFDRRNHGRCAKAFIHALSWNMLTLRRRQGAVDSLR